MPLGRCFGWPDGCRNGDSCKFIHPKYECKFFPDCAYRENCKNIHPWCPSGIDCMDDECQYFHKKKPTRLNSSNSKMGKTEGTPRKMGNWKRNITRKEESNEESDEESSRSKPNQHSTNVQLINIQIAKGSTNQHSNSKSSSSKSSKSNRPKALKIKPRNQNRGNSKPEKELNILILGETGVGKSTWINGTANYMEYETLVEAQESEQVYVIPCKFTLSDENMQERVVEVGTSDNEVTQVGQSATQGATSYIMHWIDEDGTRYRIRLIDTPGIGDVRGPEQDKININNILMYIATMGDLHGICILLPPNKARLTLPFQYCFNELLTHLHKSAAQNIVFVFTNGRGTFYRPGDTLPSLKEFLKKIEQKQKVNIRTELNTMYCMDNEAFKFLCANHAGIEFDKDDQDDYERSWDKSKIETERLFAYISQLTPHNVKDTVTLNDARKMILTLAKPLADITSNIQTNIKIIDDKKRILQSHNTRDGNLSQKLLITTVSIEAIPLGYPRTVCTAEKCIETRNIPNTENTLQTIYKTHCHTHCYLNNIVPERVPDPGLRQCAAMAGKENCQQCSCRWETHMHITYDQVQKSTQTKDPEIERLIKDNADEKTISDTAIKNCNTMIKELEHEQKVITQISVKYGIFLKKNAILPYNDVYEDYLNHAIKEEERCAVETRDTVKLDKLKQMIDEYREERKIIENAMNTQGQAITPAEVDKMKLELFNLKHKGKEIAQILNVATQAQKQMLQQQEIHSKGVKSNASTPTSLNNMLQNVISKGKLGDLKKLMSTMAL